MFNLFEQFSKEFVEISAIYFLLDKNHFRESVYNSICNGHCLHIVSCWHSIFNVFTVVLLPDIVRLPIVKKY